MLGILAVVIIMGAVGFAHHRVRGGGEMTPLFWSLVAGLLLVAAMTAAVATAMAYNSQIAY